MNFTIFFSKSIDVLKSWILIHFYTIYENQEFLNADEIKHLQKKAAIMNLKNEIIVNKNFLHKDENGLHKNGISDKNGECNSMFE